MEIQWIILAAGCELNWNRTVNIWGILHHLTVNSAGKSSPLQLIAKARFSPAESNDTKVITLRVIHSKRGELFARSKEYKVPALATVASRITYITMDLNEMPMPYSGDYTFGLLIDGDYKNEESISVNNTEEAKEP